MGVDRLIALIAAICALLFAGNYEESYENIYESQVTIVERYLISEKTDEDWQKTKELLQTTNEKAKQIADELTKRSVLKQIKTKRKEVITGAGVGAGAGTAAGAGYR